MPRDGGIIHHCNCKSSVRRRDSKRGGVCEKCHERCQTHPDIFYTRGNSCPKCKALAEIREKKENEKRGKEEELEEKEKEFWGQKGGKNGKTRGRSPP